MWSTLFTRLLAPRSMSPACAEGKQLRAEWEEACQPTSEMALEQLDLYEDRQAIARNALVAHRRSCGLCQDQRTASTGRPASPAHEVHQAEEETPDSRKAA